MKFRESPNETRRNPIRGSRESPSTSEERRIPLKSPSHLRENPVTYTVCFGNNYMVVIEPLQSSNFSFFCLYHLVSLSVVSLHTGSSVSVSCSGLPIRLVSRHFPLLPSLLLSLSLAFPISVSHQFYSSLPPSYPPIITPAVCLGTSRE